jgi:hypothetical protein
MASLERIQDLAETRPGPEKSQISNTGTGSRPVLGTGSCGHRFLTGRRSGSRRQAGQGAAEANPLPGILVDAAARETAPQTP